MNIDEGQMISTTLPIQGTFDIAKGRNSLRTHIASQRWAPAFGARAAAVLTALGELILHTNRHGLVIVRITIVEEGVDAGVHFECNIQSPEGETRQFNEAHERLQRASDHLEMREIATNIQVCTIVYVN